MLISAIEKIYEENLLHNRGAKRAGKTTFAREFLRLEVHCLNFINAAMIAEGLAPFVPEKTADYSSIVGIGWKKDKLTTPRWV